MDIVAILAALLPLLKSLFEADKAAAKAGFDGPATAFFAAKEAGKSDRAALALGASAYARACGELKELGVSEELKQGGPA